MEYDPNDYPNLAEPILQDKADVVYGSRFMGGQPHRVLYFWHRVGGGLLTLLSNMFTNFNLTDMETCYKVFRRRSSRPINVEEDRFQASNRKSLRRSRRWDAGFTRWDLIYGRTYEEGKKIGWRDGMRALWSIVRYNVLR